MGLIDFLAAMLIEDIHEELEREESECNSSSDSNRKDPWKEENSENESIW